MEDLENIYNIKTFVKNYKILNSSKKKNYLKIFFSTQV